MSDDPQVVRWGMWCRSFNDWVRFSFLTGGKRKARWWNSRREVEQCIEKRGIDDCEPRLLPDTE